MLTLQVKMMEFYDEQEDSFVSENFQLDLEHSLVALSKWESKHEKPFLDDSDRTTEEIVDYIKTMAITPDVPDVVYDHLSNDDFAKINEYISAKRSATWFSDNENKPKSGRSQETITSELIYYWMISFNIPMACENWHLNRLFTLIKVFHVKNTKPKKMSASEIAARNRDLNEKRKKQLGTTG